MAAKSKLTQNEKNLTRRYLIWCYKTTKEALDKVDRYFTQAVVDNFILDKLKRAKEFKSALASNKYRMQVEGFEQHAKTKIGSAQQQKFIDDGVYHPDYQYFQNRLISIEKAIIHFFGAAELKKIVQMYEDEMTRRILEAREH